FRVPVQCLINGGVVASTPRSQASDRFWDAFQGSWYREKDNSCVGEIYGNSMISHIQWKVPKAKTPLERLNDNTVLIEIEGHITTGTVRREGQVTILWIDGDVWLLK
ncbi:unnamed protein product, partial [Symbiodinium sp. CCMP2456]